MLKVETEEEAMKAYVQSGGARLASAVQAIPDGWVVYNSDGPLALVTNWGDGCLLTAEEWKQIQAKHGGNW